jgi:fumarate reductase (CoM/CoB) subunit A
MEGCFLEILDTDVLVIGSGAAGLRAAIESQKNGAKTTIVCKGGFPSGCTPLAMGAMQAAFDSRDSPNIHLKDTIIGGRYINDQLLVKRMVAGALKAAKDLEDFGTTFEKQDGNYKLLSFGGYSYPRAILACEPYAGGFIKGLVKKVRELGIEVVEKTMITRLLIEDHRVVGATGLSIENGDFIVFKAKSTILATGGAGHLYPFTTNPPDITGDGYALAYRVGAELMDMEFIQFRACIIYPPALKGKPPPADGLVELGGRFYNGRGERYMKKYDPIRIERVTRDLMAIYAYKEIKEGRGTPHGGVYNDLSGVPENELKRFQSFLKACYDAGIDPTWQPIEWAPGVHHFMGGVRINENAQTTIRGLFACGEVTAGIHGANRIAGNALTDALVFGEIAGRSAAKEALSLTSPKIPESQVEAERKRIFSFYKKEEGENYEVIRAKVQKIMNDYVGVIRRGDELRKAINMLEELYKIVPNMYIAGEKTYKKLCELLETINLIDVGRMVAKAALMRTESRGAHYREDFPNENNKEWLKNIIIRLRNGEMILETKKVNLIYISPE